MNLSELNKVATAMVAPGRGILAADESTGTIKKRFDALGVESTPDTRRDYREMLFRSTEAMSKYHFRACILYDETIRPERPKDGTPLVQSSSRNPARCRASRSTKSTKHRCRLAPAKVVSPKAWTACARRLLVSDHRTLGGQIPQMARGDSISGRIHEMPSYNGGIRQRARAPPLCGAVPEKDRGRSSSRNVRWTATTNGSRASRSPHPWVLKETVPANCSNNRVGPRRHGAQAQHEGARQEVGQASVRGRSRRQDAARP